MLCGNMTDVRQGNQMAKTIEVFLNCERNAILAMPLVVQKAEAMREVKMFVVPRILGHVIRDTNIPDVLVSEEMAERYLEIIPPVLSLIPDYQEIIQEIEQSYVIGNDFSALSASCVVIERLLNQARMDLHKHHKDKAIKKLWSKDATDDWDRNIEALKKWDYLDDTFASELSAVYHDIRCRYLHSGTIQSLRNDARRAIAAAYKLMTIFIGFPEDLFSWVGGSPACKNEADPRFLEFYEPYMRDESQTQRNEDI
jgi:hypothetical protein